MAPNLGFRALITRTQLDAVIFSASAKLKRETWGMNWNQALEAGGVLVSKSLDVDLEVQAVLQS